MKKAPRSGLKPTKHETKIIKAVVKEILSVCEDHFSKPTSQLNVLDMGSGNGDYAHELAKHFRNVVGIEPYEKGYNHAIQSYKRKNLKFVNTWIENFQSRKKFDVVVSLTVFEHLPNPDKSFNKVFKLLKKNGIIYLTAPNKYWLFEQHYQLPFLSWLPLPLANKYLKLTKDVDSYEDSSYSKSYFGMKRFFDKYNCEYKFILPYDKNSEYVGCGNKTSYTSKIISLGMQLISLHHFFWNFSKGFIMIIRKK